jgi:hypothetical protein
MSVPAKRLTLRCGAHTRTIIMLADEGGPVPKLNESLWDEGEQCFWIVTGIEDTMVLMVIPKS